MGMVINRFDVFLVGLDPTIGHEIQKTRPCLVVSPNSVNEELPMVIVAPLTTKGRPYVTRVSCVFRGKKSRIVIDQLRAVDKIRLVKHLGVIPKPTQLAVLSVLNAMFAP